MPRKQCVGFGPREEQCQNKAGTGPRKSPYWCEQCDNLRMVHLDNQFAILSKKFGIKEQKS